MSRKKSSPRVAVTSKVGADLVLTVSLQPRQSGLLPVPAHPAVVGSVRLLDAAVVRNVLPLSVDAVEGLVDGLGCVVAVLPDDAV